MCGIAGFIGEGNEDILKSMVEALKHRGPDQQTFYKENEVFLGHARLSILDIEGGVQPMWNEDHTIAVIFNGQIYNHIELREELIQAGHIFQSHHSDTEVLVHGYEEWGNSLPLRLNGMFSFVIYDRLKRKIFIARDQLGKKPLYYSFQKNLFAFASELSAVLKHPLVPKEINSKALQKFFAYNFIPAPYTPYQKIFKLPAGHFLEVDLNTNALTVKEYWRFRIEPVESISAFSEQEWAEELGFLLKGAVQRRLESDVPVGIFLSGGIDSTAVLALASQFGTQKTFSIGFNEASFDESVYAQRAAEHYGSHHHHKILDLTQAKALIPEVLGKLDEPMGDPSLLPTYLLSEFAKQNVTVALGGDGADELFAGYNTFKALKAAEIYKNCVPKFVHTLLRGFSEKLPISSKDMAFDFKLKRMLRGLSYPESMWNPSWLGALEPQEISELFNEPISQEDLYSEAIDAWNNTNASTVGDKTLEFYTRFYLQDDILTKVDRASMMHSLEVRAPFLDNEIVNFASKIPYKYKYRNGTTKYILKKALNGILPQWVFERRKKGFGIPLVEWLKAVNCPEMDSVFGLNADFTNKAWQLHQEGKKDYRHFMWNMLVLNKRIGE